MAKHEIDDESLPEADPLLRSAMKRSAAGSGIMQTLLTDTYWAEQAGDVKYPGVHNMLMKELRHNMRALMGERMSYREMEDYLSIVGYGIEDIRKAFHCETGFDITKLEFSRLEDANNTPAAIPWYNAGWGVSKKSKEQFYFIMPASHHGSHAHSVYLQESDMDRSEVATFATCQAARVFTAEHVKKLHCYDMTASEQADDALETVKPESTKHEYQVMANTFYNAAQRGGLNKEMATDQIKSAVFSGTLTEAEGNDLFDLYVNAAPMPPGANDATRDQSTDNPKAVPDMDYQQDTRDVMDEVERVTPQDFFHSVLPDRMDQVTPDNIRDVLTYVSHRQKDIPEFGIKLHSLEYMHHETPQVLVETSPETGRPSGPPRATVSVILELQDKTLPDEKNRKFALAVFFVSPDGEVGTSDSLKGEDDIIYGFSEDGLRQYFSKERMLHGMNG